jgi:DNA polymerase (family 10)
MENDEIIDTIAITGKLMELHNENPFKVKAYNNAAYKLSKLRYNFKGKTREEISSIEGIGAGISAKIFELITSGFIPELKSLIEKTPQGVIEMLSVKGLGPKKIRQLWLELQIESIGELLYACNENRLITLKGFGEKTQRQVRESIEFKHSNSNKYHYAALEKVIRDLIFSLKELNPNALIDLVGQMARKCEVIDKVEILIGGISEIEFKNVNETLAIAVDYVFCDENEFYYKKIELSSTQTHLKNINFSSLQNRNFENENSVYTKLALPFIEPELREGLHEVELAKQNKLPVLIELSDLKGTLHNHTTDSDGVHTLEEMVEQCKILGLTYFGVCDHSQSAFYAGGLKVEEVLQQQKQIDQLNSKDPNFRILKGIESDILSDGSLDYSDEILKTFDFIVASVHSNLKMNEEKATNRLIKAIENPYTTILGHPTGRLLLARPGYPINHKKIIDACAANGVHIELNAHPYRLDIDWRWIPYCLEKEVMISINPDAHHKEGLSDMYFGICAARKGFLNKENCLNALSLQDLMKAFKK